MTSRTGLPKELHLPNHYLRNSCLPLAVCTTFQILGFNPACPEKLQRTHVRLFCFLCSPIWGKVSEADTRGKARE